MITRCRSCEIELKYIDKNSPHELINNGIYCPICQSINDMIYHPPSMDLIGKSFECNNCHNYILYSEEDGKIIKDEIYLNDSVFVIRKPNLNISEHFVNFKLVNKFNYIIQFDFNNDLLTQLQAQILFC